MIKIIFSKLQDEKTYPDRPPEFRAEAGENPSAIATRVKNLFGDVREELKHDGIFTAHDSITLDDRSIAWVVGQLERGSLLKTDTDVAGDAFEVFSESNFVGEKGEFFTPRGVVQVAVKLVDPAPGSVICDPACGSGGFLIFAMHHIWDKMKNDPKWRGTKDIKTPQREMAARSLFGIEKEIDLVRIAKAHMAIAGDGRSNIVHENSLHDPDEFSGDALTHFVTDGRFNQFDVILTNPPFGTKAKVLSSEVANFELGYRWKKDKEGNWGRVQPPVNRDPYVLFIERCLDLLKPKGTLSIVLPETFFHAPSLAYLRHYFTNGNNLVAIIDLPHNTFRPYCNAKTCLLVLRKGEPQQEQIIMGTPEQMGHDHQGRPMYKPGTTVLWDDLAEVLHELDNVESPQNRHVFPVSWSQVDPDILMPKFYRAIQRPPQMPDGCEGVRLGALVDDGIIQAWDGHGSPNSEAKGQGDIPYIRVSDIVNWEMYRNPVSHIPEYVYDKIRGNKPVPEERDVIFVRRGSYRIGTVAMASARDRQVLLTRELLTFRVPDAENRYGLTPFYLLALLSSETVQSQIPYYVFVDTTLPNIGDRWKYLMLPIHTDIQEVNRISQRVEQIVRSKWSSQEQIDILGDQMGKLVT